MTIQLTRATYVSGVLEAAASQHTLDAATEAAFVSNGSATWVGDAPSVGGAVNPAFLTSTANGNTVLNGRDGVPFDRFPLPLNPNGLDWLTDTISGFDIYERGFVKRPTLFFDPTATSSLNRGTFAHPYNTQAALQAVISGNMAGHVLGIKRGTTLQVTGTSGLSLTCYGSSTDPFAIVPYGDAEALPIITAKSAVTTWALCADSTTVYKYTLATESDIWQNGTRVWKLNPTDTSTNNDTGTTVNSEATAVTALDAKGAGWSVYYSGVLYFRPYSGENPNLGQCVISVSNVAMLVQYTDIAGGTGYVELAGLDVSHARNTALSISAAGVVSIDAASGIVVAGCRYGMAGVDTGSPSACDGLLVYGPSDAVRLTGLYIAGNEGYDCLNNAIEISGTTAAIIEHNYGHDVGGNSIIELWSSNSGSKIRYNRGDNASNIGRRYTTFSKSGLWISGNYETGGTWGRFDLTNAKNANVTAHHNLIVNAEQKGFRLSGGTGHKIYHNTVYSDGSAAVYSGLAANTQMQAFSVGESTNAAAEGWVNISNNLVVFNNMASSPIKPAFVYCQHATAAIPNGDGNAYFQDAANASAAWGNFRAPGTTKFTWSGAGSWLEFTAASASGMDANSVCTNGLTGGTLTAALLDFDEATFTPLAANIPGITSLTGIGTRYKDGQPYVAASATIGALRGT